MEKTVMSKLEKRKFKDKYVTKKRIRIAETLVLRIVTNGNKSWTTGKRIDHGFYL